MKLNVQFHLALAVSKPRVAIIVCAAVGACAGPSPGASYPGGLGSSCFSSALVTSYDVSGERTVRATTGGNDQYDLTLAGARCDMVGRAGKLALRPVGTSILCAGNGIGQGAIEFRDPATQQRVECRIDSVRRTTPASRG